MNVRTLIPLVAGLGVGGLALYLGVNTLKNARAGQKATPRVTVWAAKAEIPRGETIAEDMLQPLPFPADLVPKGAFREKEKLVGRIPRLDAPAGLPLLEDMLAPPDAKPGIQPPEGFNAASIKVDSSSAVGYHLSPGDRVNVTASIKRPGQKETIARTILENIEVAAVGPKISASGGSGESAGGKKEAARTVREVTLFVRPEQVKTLLLAEQFGKIKLSLRSVNSSLLENEDWLSDAAALGIPEEPAAAPETPVTNIAPPPPPAVDIAAATPEPAWTTYVYRGLKQPPERIIWKNLNTPDRLEEPKPAKPAESKAAGGQTPAVPPPATPANTNTAPDAPTDADDNQEPEEPTE